MMLAWPGSQREASDDFEMGSEPLKVGCIFVRF